MIRLPAEGWYCCDRLFPARSRILGVVVPLDEGKRKAGASIEPLVVRSDENAVATLTLNRPRQFNAISMDMLAALQAHLSAIAIDSN